MLLCCSAAPQACIYMWLMLLRLQAAYAAATAPTADRFQTV